ncbi:MAG TPA: hypothetical protein VFT66_26890 [Roseiflexaceae bacterium]|nr:hypothetical protein [Roseiflexaceae bacterium]
MVGLNMNTRPVSGLIQRRWALPAVLFVVAGLIYWLSARLLGRTHSPDTAYFNDLADAFLHGRLYLAKPPARYDLTQYKGKWYVPFPPLPTLLMLPWVAAFGLKWMNTVVFGAVVGAANVTFAFLLLQSLARRGWTGLQRSGNLWLTVLFGVGSVHWYVATQGSVWFVSQLCTLTFILLAAWLAVATDAPLLSGAALALAMLGRPHVALCYPLLLGIHMQHAQDRMQDRSAWRWLRWGAFALVPLALSGAALLAYNAARFDNPLDFGYLRQNVSSDLAADLRRYGQFNLHYVPHNVWAMLLSGPAWDAKRNLILPTVYGMSLLLTTPALVYLLNAFCRSPLVIGAWVATALILVPLLTYYNTGWWQFGYRFSLDFMTPVLILLAVGAGANVGWKLRALILLGVVVNAWGTWWFQNPRFFS